jgi:hypothetical protein
VAIDVLALLQVPPVTLLVNEIVEPVQTEVGPERVPGSGVVFTVILRVAAAVQNALETV